ncbi:MAG: dihydroneopterin aldolase ['Candidatus Kapabacteria' thiocyanatum]|uniref:7,8-dihydroneopterin aldolase n=1 Tax=Candidatus Kapaibacterium thiocyanatum TaxID=1895771 RepID=A0A1M3KYI5_9BACT|nr:dihydroneopterin aldolase ['Candidatus Kapabacteria' thiocyanatum]OJX57587.1 MAG: dihydroneopterin aldolase ['Candidatus Kapabacteria' thiocyanatum]
MARHVALTRLSISNAEFYAFHGVRNEEQQLGGRYQVDVDLFYNATQAVVSDNLNDTINYEEVLFIVNEHMNGEPYDLIETIAYDVATAILDRFGTIHQATVRVRKMNVPIQQIIDYVEAEYSVVREG